MKNILTLLLSFSLVLSLGILFFSCTKNETSNEYDFTVTFTQKTKEWYFYKQNSYWIYRNDSTGILDSLVVDSSNIYMVTGQYPTEMMNILFKPNIFGISHEFMDSRWQYNYGMGLYFTDLSQYYAFPGLDGNDAVGYIQYFYNEKYEKTGQRKTIDYFSVFTTNSKTYSNVYKVEIQDYIRNKTINYWFGKNSGIIKQEYEDSTGIRSWTLQQSEVIQ